MAQGGIRPREVVVWIDGKEAAMAEIRYSSFKQTLVISEPLLGALVKKKFTRASDLFGRIVMYKY